LIDIIWNKIFFKWWGAWVNNKTNIKFISKYRRRHPIYHICRMPRT